MEAGGGGGAEEEQVMSEVHLGCPPHVSGLHVSRFSFSSRPIEPSGDSDGVGGGGSELVAATTGSCDSPDTVAVDEDGDLVLDRRRRRNKYVRSDCHLLTIQHGVTSSLKRVGLQVWKAALLLADFVLHKSVSSSSFDGVTAIEIGAGTGLVGLALARVASRIFVTDRGTDILDNCLANVHINSGTLKFDEAKVCVRELDWKTSWPPPVGTYDPSDPRLGLQLPVDQHALYEPLHGDDHESFFLITEMTMKVEAERLQTATAAATIFCETRIRQPALTTLQTLVDLLAWNRTNAWCYLKCNIREAACVCTRQ